MTPTTKRENYALYERGLYGNKFITWDSLDDYLNSSYSKPVVMRYKGAYGGKWCTYGLDRDGAIKEAARWISEGATRSLIALNELAEDSELVLQGEVRISECHYDLRCSFVPKPMRIALQEKQYHYSGLRALETLRYYMSVNSFSDLEDLLLLYPDAIIEFSSYRRYVGILSRRNTIILGSSILLKRK